MKNIYIFFVFITSLNFAQTTNFSIKNIDANKKFEDFGVSYLGDSLAVFSSASYGVFMRRVWSKNHEPFLSLLQGTIDDDGQIKNIKPFAKKIDTRYHESDLTFTKDQKTVYFSRNNYFHKNYKTDSTGVNLIQIYKAKIEEDGKWKDIERLPFNSDQYDSGHPCLNKDETKLYFISDMPGTYGETDIFYVDIINDSIYGKPVNLGPIINTPHKEMFPFMDDDDELYFSSYGHSPNYGELDIFVSKQNRKNIYEKPINLGPTINSVADDFAFVKRKGKNSGHFSSNRENGKGDDDIYAFVENTPIKFACDKIIKGTITDSKTNDSLPASLITLYKNNKQVNSVIADEYGKYEIDVTCGTEYKIIANHEKFIHGTRKIIANAKDTIIDIALNSEFIGLGNNELMMNIDPIYFDKDKAVINKSSEPQLQEVVDIMNRYPNIIIQIRAHTDARGTEDHNLKLSQRRAEATKQWIIRKGIPDKRIFALGFGESEPVNECKSLLFCSKEILRANRRTEFVVLNPATTQKQ